MAISDGTVDVRTTQALRADGLPAAAGWLVEHGPERVRYEAIWPVKTSVALAGAVLSVPPGLRRPVLEWTRAQAAEGTTGLDPADRAEYGPDPGARTWRLDVSRC